MTAVRVIYFLDHYDSFSANILAWIRAATHGSRPVRRVFFDDAAGMAEVLASPAPTILSPGPGHPRAARPTLASVEKLLNTVPILGICLGHQILAHCFGYKIIRVDQPHHGADFACRFDRSHPIFAGLPQEFRVGVYNSLTVQSSLGDPRVIAIDHSDQIMAMDFGGAMPCLGIQFHPESFLTEYAPILGENILSYLL